MTHGFIFGLERRDATFFLSCKAIGKLTDQDYQKLTPMIDGALGAVDGPLVYAFMDVTEMEGWEPKAAWDDFKIGMKHRKEFKKVALYGNKSWQDKVSKLFTWFISGDVQFFEDKEKALEWLSKE